MTMREYTHIHTKKKKEKKNIINFLSISQDRIYKAPILQVPSALTVVLLFHLQVM